MVTQTLFIHYSLWMSRSIISLLIMETENCRYTKYASWTFSNIIFISRWILVSENEILTLILYSTSWCVTVTVRSRAVCRCQVAVQFCCFLWSSLSCFGHVTCSFLVYALHQCQDFRVMETACGNQKTFSAFSTSILGTPEDICLEIYEIRDINQRLLECYNN